MKRFKNAAKMFWELCKIPGFWIYFYSAVINTILLVKLLTR